MATVSSALNVGIQAASFAVLDKSAALNKFANWITGGRVNADTLAKNLFHQAVEMGADFAISNKLLGDRSAKLIPLIKDAAVDNNSEKMKSAVADLVSEGLGQVMDTTHSSGVLGLVKTSVEGAARAAGVNVAEQVVGDHATEKILSTLVKEHGWKPLESYLQKIIGARPGGDFIVGQIKSVLQRAIVNNPEFDKTDNAEYRLAAGVLNEFLTDDKDYEKPLRAYAPKLATAYDTVKPVYDTAVQYIKEDIPNGIDSLQRAIVGAPEPQLLEQAYGSKLNEKEPAIEISQKTTARDLADEVIKEQVIANGNRAFSDPLVTREDSKIIGKLDQALENETIAQDKHEQLDQVANLLSTEHLRPLGERGDVTVARTWSDRLDRVEAHSYFVTHPTENVQTQTKTVLSQAPNEQTLVGGYKVASHLLKNLSQLNLDLPASAMGYSDSTVEGSKALLNAGWSWFGYDTGPSYHDSAVLKQLYNTCDKNEKVMAEVTRYLNPNLAKNALAVPALQQMRDPNTGLVTAGNTQIKLTNPDEPKVNFNVRNMGNFVQIAVEVNWDIAAYGTSSSEMRTPHGQEKSVLTSTAVITIPFNQNGSEAETEYFPMGTLSAIANIIAFDTQTGSVI